MKKKFTPLIVVGIVLVVAVLFIMRTKSQPFLIASGHPEWAPIMSQSGDQIVGVGPALVEKIFTQLGVKVKSDFTGAWDSVQSKAKTGEVDVLVAAYKTDERESYMDYSIAYVKDPIAIFTSNESQLSYGQWSDLIGKKGVATIGDSYGQEFDAYIKDQLEVERVSTVKQAFDMLIAGDADYFLYALYSGNSEIKKLDYSDKIKSLPEYVSTEDFYIAISKKSPYAKYLPKVNELIKQYKEDGTINKLMEEYQK